MKNAFTIIELVFVIIVIGILAGIAMPRFFQVGYSAHEAKLVGFTSSLNRTAGHEMWAVSMSTGHQGSVKFIGTNTYKYFRKIPKEILNKEVNLSNCGTGMYQTVAEANTSYTGGIEYNITCKDGDATTPPFFKLIRQDGKVLVSRGNE